MNIHIRWKEIYPVLLMALLMMTWGFVGTDRNSEFSLHTPVTACAVNPEKSKETKSCSETNDKAASEKDSFTQTLSHIEYSFKNSTL